MRVYFFIADIGCSIAYIKKYTRNYYTSNNQRYYVRNLTFFHQQCHNNHILLYSKIITYLLCEFFRWSSSSRSSFSFVVILSDLMLFPSPSCKRDTHKHNHRIYNHPNSHYVKSHSTQWIAEIANELI